MSSEAPEHAAEHAAGPRTTPARPPSLRQTTAGAFDDSVTTPPDPAAPEPPRRKKKQTEALPGAAPAGPPVVAVENLGKCYHIYNRPEDRLKQALFRWRGKTYYEDFWALRHVSFEVYPGEALGIVGRNGSGKSTLMQMIAGTLAPTTGSVTVRGRVAALLELGSGFNPDFTGRENVFLYGAILGLSKREVEERFDEIAAFADIGRFLDQPIKTYSTGMKVRLAFAVQVQVRPEVLIIDEALTVGDNLFQKRCHERLRLLREAGTTLLFVSHQQEIIRTLTSRCLMLHKGEVKALGTPAEVLLEYRRVLHEEEKRWTTQRLAAAGSVEPASVPSNAALGGRCDVSATLAGAADVLGSSGTGRAEPRPVARAEVPLVAAPSDRRQTPDDAMGTEPKEPRSMARADAAASSASAAETSAPAPATEPERADPAEIEVHHPSDARSYGDGDATIARVEVLGADGEGCSLFYPGDRVMVRVGVRFHKPVANANIALRLRDKQGVKVYSWGTLNQDIAGWCGSRPYDDGAAAGGEREGELAAPAAFWDRSFEPGASVTVEFEWVCTLGAGFYEVQACVTHEPTPDYRNLRMLHWVDEAAFFEVKIARSEYFFGGMVDLRMRANVLD